MLEFAALKGAAADPKQPFAFSENRPMNPTFIPLMFFVLTAFLLLQRGVNKIRWTLDDEMSRVRGIIEKGLVPAMLRDLRSTSFLALSIAIGSYEMSNRIAWWMFAGFLALPSLLGFVVSRFVTYQDMNTQLIPEDEVLNRKVRTKKIVGVVFFVFLAGWLASGFLYFPKLSI